MDEEFADEEDWKEELRELIMNEANSITKDVGNKLMKVFSRIGKDMD